MTFGACKSAAELVKLNAHLVEFTYVGGNTVNSDDADIYAKLSKQASTKVKDFVAISRWVKHMASYSPAEMKSFPQAKKTAKKTPAKKSSEAVKTEDVLAEPKKEVDLFGSDSEESSEDSEAERQKEAIMAAKAKKPKNVINKSSLVYMIQANPDITDYSAVVEKVKAIEIEGCTWGENFKTVPLAFGLQKIQMTVTIIDDVVETGNITEAILRIETTQEAGDRRMKMIEEGEDEDDEEEYYICTAEIASFQKL